MGLFSQAKMDEINAIAEKSKEVLKPIKVSKSVTSSQQEIQQSTKAVLEYFKDSPAILITSKAQLHEYVLKAIESGYCGIDTETTGLDRTHDTIVGASLYYPGGVECYIPCKHLAPVFEVPYENQLSYEDVGSELQLFVDAKTKMILANADFDIAMVYKDFKVDLIPVCYYDVISAWRCIKEDEEDNRLKALYMKYVKKGKGDPKSFSDFFNPKLFPYCQPEVAKLYAANDAKITYELFMWQLPLVTKTHPRCQKRHLEKIADLWWNIELPMIRVCALMHRTGVYFDKADNAILKEKYDKQYAVELKKLAEIVQEIMDNSDAVTVSKSPFKNGAAFNEASSLQVKYLLNNFLHCNVDSGNKETLKELNLPVTNQILNVRAINKLLNTFIDKLPREVAKDGRIHSTFSSMGASTGRMCIAKGTKITCLNGLKNIEDIVPGDIVYCYDENGILQLKPVKHLWLTGHDRECVRVKWQSSGKGDVGELICTPEHRILKKDGTWCRADELKRYNKLAHLRRTEPKSGECRPELYGWNGLATREQDVVKYSIFHAESSMIIHHKDGDKTNNSLDNLEIMTNSEHCRYHSTEMQKSGILSYKYMQTPEARAKLSKTIIENHKQKCINNKEYYLELIKQYQGRLSDIPYDFDSFRRNCAIAGIDLYAECAKYNSRHVWRTIPKDKYVECYLRNDGSTTKIARELNITTQTAHTLREKYANCLNHMVLKVEPAGKFDVYDIEVEDIHNFIANEICVHNSSSNPNVQQIPSHALDIRHEFRATPAMEKIIDTEYNEESNIITAELCRWDSVTTEDGQIDVEDLEVGMRVKLLDEKTEVWKSILSISEPLSNKLTYRIVTFGD